MRKKQTTNVIKARLSNELIKAIDEVRGFDTVSEVVREGVARYVVSRDKKHKLKDLMQMRTAGNLSRKKGI